MTTTTLHGHVQRTRFAHHALALLRNLTPPLFRGPPAYVPAHAVAKVDPSAATRLAEKRQRQADSAAREAQRLRDFAQGYMKTDPSFASDLFAAAMRHEQTAGDAR